DVGKRDTTVTNGAGTGAVDLGTAGAITGAGAFSVEGWFNIRSVQKDGFDRLFVQSEDFVGGNSFISLQLLANQTLKVTVSAATVITATGNKVLQPNTWYHIVVTRDSAGSKLSIYINGAIDNAVTGGSSPVLATGRSVI